MTAQLAAALKRSIFPALLAALAGAGAAVAQVQIGASQTQVWITIGLGAFSAAAVVVVRGVGEGLNDGQRAAIGKVLDSDVTAASVTAAESTLVPLIQSELAKAGINVTAQSIDKHVEAAQAFAKQVFDAKQPTTTDAAAAPADATAAASDPFVHGAVAPPEHTPDAMLPADQQSAAPAS